MHKNARYVHTTMVYNRGIGRATPRNFRSTHVKTTFPTPGGKWCIRKLDNEHGWWRAYSIGPGPKYIRDFHSFNLAVYYTTMMVYVARRFPTKDGTHNKVSRHIIMKKLHKSTLLPIKKLVDDLIKEYRYL